MPRQNKYIKLNSLNKAFSHSPNLELVGAAQKLTRFNRSETNARRVLSETENFPTVHKSFRGNMNIGCLASSECLRILYKGWCRRQNLGVVYGKKISFEGGLGSFWDFLFHSRTGVSSRTILVAAAKALLVVG
jgi:hypothetical protein